MPAQTPEQQLQAVKQCESHEYLGSRVHEQRTNLLLALHNRGYTVSIDMSDKENKSYHVHVSRDVQNGMFVQSQVVLNNSYSSIGKVITALRGIQ